MRLEDEIKQKKFKSEHHKLLINLIYTGSWVKSMHSDLLKPSGLTLEQYNLLRILRGQQSPASINLLIERMLDKMSNASRLVEKLRQKGLLERKENDNDRRQADVLITSKGLELLQALDSTIVQIEKRTKVVTEAEAKIVNDVLDRLRG
ncbi:MarR family transcriptional regulator [soil metagenome]